MKTILILLLFWQWVWAAPDEVYQAIEIASQQPILSQKIAKNYLALQGRVCSLLSKPRLAESLKQFEQNQQQLMQGAYSKEITELLTFTEYTFSELKDLVQQPYTPDNGSTVLDLSETLLETSTAISQQLEMGYRVNRLVNLSHRQAMLAQRIAKYYIAYQMGFKDPHSVEQLKKAVAEFKQNLALLEAQPDNSYEVKQLLEKIHGQWDVVHQFFLSIQKGGMSVMVYVATKRIDELCQQLAQFYIEQTGG